MRLGLVKLKKNSMQLRTKSLEFLRIFTNWNKKLINLKKVQRNPKSFVDCTEKRCHISCGPEILQHVPVIAKSCIILSTYDGKTSWQDSVLHRRRSKWLGLYHKRSPTGCISVS
ncbi:hypothetical protein AVEN_29329-1 [Araneus ventricosus]|uniref:Uncharacterized protein n=1 Tax=Araneus ventricosus TaxID=182803 RepID=A0A4Y2IX92_ARAVE|nr:hypothetical protein AVEN_29329-1 [Araneus ventricosus]